MRRHPREGPGGGLGEVVLEGLGLHTARPSRLVLRRRAGPISFVLAHREAPLESARVVGTARATTLEVSESRFGTVEHLLSALGGLGLHSGVCLELTGPELPLLDGGARSYVDALLELGIPGGETPALAVVRDDEVHVGESSYAFKRGEEIHVHVSVDFGDARLDAAASWDGDARDYRARIAPARTFAFAAELLALAHQGGTAHASPESVIVLAPDRVLSAGALFSPDEPARHKLLDLVGDLFFYGGPPRGAVFAHRPGHGSTHVAMRQAIERGIVRRGRAHSA
jgi:UDP-3-O-[3-hydroxymyristoyl] N-acetylglucosamine deacetylase